MRQHSNSTKDPAEKVVKDIRRATRKQYSAEEKIRIVLEGLRGEDSIAEPSCAGVRASHRTCITAGRKTFLRLARSAWPVTRPVPRPRTRSRICGVRLRHSRRWLPI